MGNTQERLPYFRNLMTKKKFDVYLVPKRNEHAVNIFYYFFSLKI